MSEAEARLVCIACPKGCLLTVRKAASGTASAAASGTASAMVVEGNRCPKGEVYGREELIAPRRTVTASMRTDCGDHPCVPVRTDRPLARGMVRDLLRELYAGRVKLPVRLGDAVVRDWRGTGVCVVATRTLPPDQVPPVRQAGPEAEGDDQVPAAQ